VDPLRWHAVFQCAAPHAGHERHRAAQVDVGVSREVDMGEVDQAGAQAGGGLANAQVLVPLVEGRTGQHRDEVCQFRTVGVPGGRPVGVQDQHLTGGGGPVEVMQEADHRRDPDSGRGQDKRRACLGQGQLAERRRHLQRVALEDVGVQEVRHLAGGNGPVLVPARRDRLDRDGDGVLLRDADEAVLPDLPGPVGQAHGHRDVLAGPGGR
jgi:hypothetical protein